jgi:AAA+ ATPase superfamily predicted ATPase
MNPFIISSYKSPEYFCDREQETKKVIGYITNGVNLVISSLRRMGKTGLIRHVFHLLEKEDDHHLFYIDLDQTENLNGLVNKMANGLLRNTDKRFYERFLEFLKQFRPVLTFNPVTGMPEVTIRQEDSRQDEVSIEAILGYLEKLDRPAVVALDEFQRITSYPENHVEAFLRSHIQHLQNVRFIFAGSSRNLMQSMFNDYSRPFYQSAAFMNLDRLDGHLYTDFVQNHFEKTGRSIGADDIRHCIEWADNHTFYMQYLFNAIWGSGIEDINRNDIINIQQEILSSRTALYTNYRNLLTDNQYQLLRAITLETEVRHPNSIEFIRKYGLGSISTISSALKVLVEKELVYSERNHYKVYDVFQSQWFRMLDE